VTPRKTGSYLFASEYFAEEVRRELIGRYGNDALYEGGLSVRTTLDPRLQAIARKALQKGLISYDERRGFRGPVNERIDISGDWGVPLAEVDPLRDVPEWQLAVVLSASAGAVEVGLRPGREVSGKVEDERVTGTILADNMKWAFRLNLPGEKATNVKSAADVLNPGDVVYVQQLEKDGEQVLRLRQPPKVQGALVAMDPHTGRVLAMVGGSPSPSRSSTAPPRLSASPVRPSSRLSTLPLSTMDIRLLPWFSMRRSKSFPVASFGSPRTMAAAPPARRRCRLGIERSRNLMTVRLAQDMGMNLVAEYAERFGVYDDMLPVLAMSLGSGETTVMRMASAYSVLANGGKQIKPSLIDRIQDRYGKTIFKHEERSCDACIATAWLSQEEPEVVDTREQVLDPMTAYQITSMMEGVVTRGTAASKVNLDRPTAGKTGTTNEEKDAWFIGYTADLVAGVFIGYDTPTPMGRGSTGGALAAPVFNEFMQGALEGTRPRTSGCRRA
jgi:penicillin-binding protein 1A